MVLIESTNNTEIKHPEEKAMSESEKIDKTDAQASAQKLFSCEELERSIGSQLTDTLKNSTEELKQVDPAIMSCSSKIKLTRYSKEELFELKNSKLSKETPKCLLKPEIIALDIVDNVGDVTGMMGLLNMYKDRYPEYNQVGGTWNPNCAQFLADYNRFLISNPIYANHMNQMNNPYTAPYQQQSFMPSMPYVDPQHHAAFLDKIPPYDRNNFFDTITTTTAIRPPPPRMGVNSLNTGQNAYQNRSYNNHNNGYMRRPNAYNNERYSGGGRNSFGNDSNRSSSFENTIQENSKELRDNANKKDSLEKLIGESNGEAEPEWYTNPASVDDVIDLHGFEEGDNENQPHPKVNPTNEKGYGTPSLAYRRSGYNQNRNMRGNFNNNNYVNTNYNTNNGGYYNNQRFRNPLHYNNNNARPMPSYQNPINPFFEAWQKARCAPGETSNSFNALINRARGSMPPNPNPISDVESTLRASNYLASLINKSQMTPQQQQQISMPISTFFNNWPQQQQAQMAAEAQMRVNGLKMPTQEQLQQHTTEIMRNAILRKNQQQYQYHDERAQFQK